MNIIGPTFYNELKTAGLHDKGLGWGDDGKINGRDNLSEAENATLQAVIDAHDPALEPIDAYRQRRADEMPPLGDVIDAICKFLETGDTTEFDAVQAVRAAVKAKHPKP